jgi:pimeloyl-ACP methyl ester carboxylesterase
MAVTEAGDGPAVVFCHGFPEIAYSWRKQIPALAAAGFHPVAPDQRGYGDTDRPVDVAAYDIHQLTADLAGLLDALDVERAVFVGHDWGGIVAWYMPLLHRNIDRNWETTAQLAGARIEVPSLMVTAEHDPVLRPELADGMRDLVPDLEVRMIAGCGHWTQQEKPAELNAIMIDWITRRFGTR